MSEVLPLLASLTLAAGVYCYLRQVQERTSIPNPTTWFLWVVISIFNSDTYNTVVHENKTLWFITLVATIGIAAIFAYSVLRGRFGMIGWVDGICAILVIGIWMVRRNTRNDILANVFLQVVFVISYIPTVAGLLRGKLREKMLPWALGVTAYSLQVATIMVSWNEGSVYELVHPIANGIAGNGSVILTLLWIQRHPRIPRVITT